MIVVSDLYDVDRRCRSFEIIAEAADPPEAAVSGASIA
jgi:hypothetical protein